MSKEKDESVMCRKEMDILDSRTFVNVGQKITKWSNEHKFYVEFENLIYNRVLTVKKIHNNIGRQICELYTNPDIVSVMVIGMTQSGKTTYILTSIKYMILKGLVPVNNVFIITGLSSVEWLQQTTKRIPDILRSRVYHRCNLNEDFISEIQNLTNILIIIDEVHIASKKYQTIHSVFERAGLLDIQNLYRKNIKIMEISATPNGTLYNLVEWGKASEFVYPEVDIGYTSCFKLLNTNRVRQYKDLCGYDDATNSVDSDVFTALRELKIAIRAYDEPLYHIIRTRTGFQGHTTIENFKTIFSQKVYKYLTYDQDSKTIDINSVLKSKPLIHTFIFIKERLRCSKTLEKEYIGILYERYTPRQDDSTIIQGLLGRMTGYVDNGKSIVYTNIKSIELYKNLVDSNYQDTSIAWNSETTRYHNGNLIGKETFVHMDQYMIKYKQVENHVKKDIPEPVILKFDTRDEAIEYYTEKLSKIIGGTGPRPVITLDENGFYLARFNSKHVVASIEDVMRLKRHGLGKTTRYRLVPCYKDITDNTTVQWWLIYYA